MLKEKKINDSFFKRTNFIVCICLFLSLFIFFHYGIHAHAIHYEMRDGQMVEVTDTDAAALANNANQSFMSQITNAYNALSGGAAKTTEEIKKILFSPKSAWDTFLALPETSHLEDFMNLSSWKQWILASYMGDVGINLGLVVQTLMISDSEYRASETVWHVLFPIGICMSLLYFLIDIYDKTTMHVRDFDMKTFLLSFAKLVISIAIITWGPHVIVALIEIGNGLILKFVQGGGTSLSNTQEQVMRAMLDYMENMGFLGAIGMIVGAIILQLANVIPSFLILFQAISRKLELILMVGLFPVALPDMYNGLSNSRALSYAKKFAAVCLNGMIMLAVIKISTSLQGSFMEDIYKTMIENQGSAEAAAEYIARSGIAALIPAALYGFAAAGLISSSKTIVRDALGA